MKLVASWIVGLLLMTACTAAPPSATMPGGTSAGTRAQAGGEIVLSTTTSTRDSGLLDFLLPKFEEQTGIQVKVVALGTGAAIEAAKAGNADVLMVHDKAKEEQFVAEGYGLIRHDLMYNDFLLVGEAQAQTLVGNETHIVALLKIIADRELPFVSRGDESGTHSFELRTWKTAGVTPPESDSPWYFSVGQGMGETLNITAEKKGFTIADRSTYLATREYTGLVEVSEPSGELVNQYGIIELDPRKVTVRNPQGARTFIQWLLSDEATAFIEAYGRTEYGQQLFFPGTFPAQ